MRGRGSPRIPPAVLLLFTVLGCTLAFSPPRASSQNPTQVLGGSSFVYTASPNGTSDAANGAPNSLFVGNATLVTNGTVRFSFLGVGGNDTFDFYGGNASGVFLATGVLSNSFNVVTGNPATETNSSSFSLVSGTDSTFNLIQDNFNGSVAFSVIGGPDSFLNDTSVGPVSDTTFSINLGTNSTVSIGSLFTGNETTVNVVY